MMTYARFLLYPDEVLRFDAHQPLAIRCERGRLWLTAGTEGIDHHLRTGETTRSPAGRILIEGDGIVTLAEAATKAIFPLRGEAPFANLALLAAPAGGRPQQHARRS